MEESVEGPGPPCRREVQPSGSRLPLYYGGGKTGSGRGRRRKRVLGVGATGAPGGSGERRGRLRQRSWVPRGNWVPRRSYRCSYPRPLSWHPQTRTRGGPLFRLCLPLSFGLFFSFVISLVPSLSSWDRPGRRAKGSLQHAATARTADGKNVRRHSLDGLVCEYD